MLTRLGTLLVLCLGLSACGIDGAPVPPDTEGNPNIADAPEDVISSIERFHSRRHKMGLYQEEWKDRS